MSKEKYLILLDSNDEPYMVRDVDYPFTDVDAVERMAVEGLEEDGMDDTAASVARGMLVAAFREQSRRLAIAGTGVSMDAANAAAKRAEMDTDASAPHEMAQNGNASIVRLTGDYLAPLAAVLALDMAWADEFEKRSGIKIADRGELERQIEKTTREAIAESKTVSDMLNSKAFSAERATMIIRTEAAKAAMMARLESMGGVEKVWRTTPGACKNCLALEGVTLPLAVKFKNNGMFGEVLTPPGHPNCRCSIEKAKK